MWSLYCSSSKNLRAESICALVGRIYQCNTPSMPDSTVCCTKGQKWKCFPVLLSLLPLPTPIALIMAIVPDWETRRLVSF